MTEEKSVMIRPRFGARRRLLGFLTFAAVFAAARPASGQG
jgi:hypothetical protein